MENLISPTVVSPTVVSPTVVSPTIVSEDIENTKTNLQNEAIFCNICQKTIDVKEMLKTSCNHEFCGECFFKWLKEKPNCPLCRTQFTKPRNEELTEEIEVLLLDIDDYTRYRDLLAQGIIKEEQRLKRMYEKENKKIVKLEDEKKNLNKEIINLKNELEEIIKEKNIEEAKIRIYKENQKIEMENKRKRFMIKNRIRRTRLHGLVFRK